MKFLKTKNFYLTLVMILAISSIFAAMVPGQQTTAKQHDLSKYHNVGNIWLRVSNYGFFGSGDDITPPWPSLEYPGGSGVDYLYQGALWFGAKKYRKDNAGNQVYWTHWPPKDDNDHSSNPDYQCPDPYCTYNHIKVPYVDTLVTVGFDGDADLYEFLPAYNALEYNIDGYQTYNRRDVIMTTSTRNHRKAQDDDGDGMIDEDPVGFAFPFRNADELPPEFAVFSGKTIAETFRDPATSGAAYQAITDNVAIWFPLGFQDLSYPMRPEYLPPRHYNFADVDPATGISSHDDDHDGIFDEDGFPVSEQDYISYYYDYSPFNTPGERDYGGARGRNTHIPLRLFVRQMSYQWSYDYIKNLVYIEFNITNMNQSDTLYDCAMGIYMDCDVGPQSLDGQSRAQDDKSGYVRGTGYEFAFTFDADFDGGLSPGYVGARVCTPDPEQLEFACWYWKVGDGPNDSSPRNFSNLGSRKTANEKYWLLTNRNPDANKYSSLRKTEEEQIDPVYIQPNAVDTRFLFAFYGDMMGMEAPTDSSWNLPPGRSMKIVVAVFPGETIEELKSTAAWAKTIYGQAQTLTTAILPDIFPHYDAPEPPPHPYMYSELTEKIPNRINLDVFWGNRSEFCEDLITVEKVMMGWNIGSGLDSDPALHPWLDANYIDRDDPLYRFAFGATDEDGNLYFPPDQSSYLNPLTAYRIRHDFQGYKLWGRSGRGDSGAWEQKGSWDKIDTETDREDYVPKWAGGNEYVNFGGDLSYDVGLPQQATVNDSYVAVYNDPFTGEFEVPIAGYYMQDDNYILRPIEDVYDAFKANNGKEEAFYIYGIPLYNQITRKEAMLHPNFTPYPSTPAAKAQNQLLFMNPALDARFPNDKAKANRIYLALIEDELIPLPGHLGQSHVVSDDPEPNLLDPNLPEKRENREKRLARRFYQSEITNLPKGREYYVSVTAFDRGLPRKGLGQLESGKDANMEIFFPGPLAKTNMNNIYVVPNPYRGTSTFDGKISGDNTGDKSRRLWFVNLPERCNVQIYTLAGDLVDEFEHDGAMPQDIITISKAAEQGIAASGIHPWNLLSKYNQIVASGLYFFSVKDRSTGDVKVGKFAIIR